MPNNVAQQVVTPCDIMLDSSAWAEYIHYSTHREHSSINDTSNETHNINLITG